MTARNVVFVYFAIMFPIILLYVFTVVFPAYSTSPMPDLHAAVPVLLDLIKIVVGGAIGAFSASLGKPN